MTFRIFLSNLLLTNQYFLLLTDLFSRILFCLALILAKFFFTDSSFFNQCPLISRDIFIIFTLFILTEQQTTTTKMHWVVWDINYFGTKYVDFHEIIFAKTNTKLNWQWSLVNQKRKKKDFFQFFRYELHLNNSFCYISITDIFCYVYFFSQTIIKFNNPFGM